VTYGLERPASSMLWDTKCRTPELLHAWRQFLGTSSFAEHHFRPNVKVGTFFRVRGATHGSPKQAASSVG
jgi:hypothetical protein